MSRDSTSIERQAPARPHSTMSGSHGVMVRQHAVCLYRSERDPQADMMMPLRSPLTPLDEGGHTRGPVARRELQSCGSSPDCCHNHIYPRFHLNPCVRCHNTRHPIGPRLVMPYTIAADPYYEETAKTRTPEELEAAVLLLEFHSHGRPAAAPGRRRWLRNAPNTREVPETDTQMNSKHESRPLGPRAVARLRTRYDRRRQGMTATQDSTEPKLEAKSDSVNPEAVAIAAATGHSPSAQACPGRPSGAEAEGNPRRSARLDAKAKQAIQKQR